MLLLIQIQRPNYKNSHGIILKAECVADYKFIFVDIGASGRNNDSGVFKRSAFGNYITKDQTAMMIPEAIYLQGSDFVASFVFIGDEAIPLMKNLLRPYRGRRNLNDEKNIFNYRLSRTRIVVEKAFGFLASKWSIYRKPIIATRKTTQHRQSHCLLA